MVDMASHAPPTTKAAADAVADTVSTSASCAAVAHDVTPEGNTLVPGAKVMLHSLTNAKYNRAIARVVKFNPARDRWEVQLETTGRNVLIKAVNLCVGIADTPEQLVGRSQEIAELIARMGRVSEDKRERGEDGSMLFRL